MGHRPSCVPVVSINFRKKTRENACPRDKGVKFRSRCERTGALPTHHVVCSSLPVLAALGPARRVLGGAARVRGRRGTTRGTSPRARRDRARGRRHRASAHGRRI
eukprot:478993-Prymnesium_polylepis.1